VRAELKSRGSELLCSLALWPCKLLARWLSRRSDAELTRLAQALATLFWTLFSKRRAIGLRQLRAALGAELGEEELSSILRQSYTQLGLTALNALKRIGSPGRDLAGSQDQVTIIGREHLTRALARGGVVFASGHLGDWEQLLTLHALTGREVLLLSKRFKSALAQTLWDWSRAHAPTRLDQGPRALQLIEHLKSGGCVADVIDQHDPRAKARRLCFMGQEASISPDLITLAERGDATLLPVFTWREPLPREDHERQRHVVLICAPVWTPKDGSHQALWARRDQALSACLQALELQVRRRPEQWLWIHRLWKPQPLQSSRQGRGRQGG